MNRYLVILIYIVLVILPFAVLIFQIENDVSNDLPTIHAANFNLPLEDDSNVNPFVGIDLGKMEVDWEIFIKVELNRSDGIFPTAYLLIGNQYDLYVRQIQASREKTGNFASSVLIVWFNVTVIISDNYYVVVESALGPVTQVTIEYWYQLPPLLIRDIFSIIFSFMGYFLVLGIVPGRIKQYRLRKYRRRENLERERREDREYQLSRQKK